MRKVIKIFLIVILLINILMITACGDKHTHTESDWEITKDATCTEDGKKEKKCTECKEVLVTEKIDKLEHNYQEGKCSCGDVDPNYKPKHVHTEVVIPGKDATCTEAGLTEGEKCSECGEILVAQTEIAAKGHTEVVIPGKDATCEEKGLTEGKKCSVCEEVLVAQTEIAAKGHNYVDGECSCGEKDPNYNPEHIHTESDWEITKEATCIEHGEKEKKCTECKEVLVTEKIDKLEHNYQEGKCSCGAKDPNFEENIIVSEGLEYELNDDGISYVVIGIGTCEDSKIVIPSTFNNFPVTRIGVCAFLGCVDLINIEIPSSITIIDDNAFAGCSSLINIEIPNSVNKIGYNAFGYCTNLKKVIFGENIRLADIGNYTYENCTSLESIEIPTSVTSIGEYAFYNCTSLKEIIFEKGSQLKNIDYAAFENCTSLESIEIPSSATSIDSPAFINCTKLESINVDENNEYYKSIDGVLYSKDGTILIQYPFGKKDSNFRVPNEVINIEFGAFKNCALLESIEIPTSVTSIGQYVFYNCTSLESIEIPTSVTSIGKYVFYNCTSLKEVIFEQGSQIKNIDYAAFENCISLVNIEIPTSVTIIRQSAFSNCTSLESIEILNSIMFIGKGAFYNCTSLTIYCELEKQSIIWDNDWNISNCPVVWGYKEKRSLS